MSSRVIIDLDSKQEVVIPDILPDPANNPNNNNAWSNLHSDKNTRESFLSNFITNMNLEIKDEPNIEMPVHSELYRVESPEPLYHPNIFHDIYLVDQLTKNVYHNGNPYFIPHYLNNFPNNIPPFPNNIPPFPNNIPPFPNNIPPFPNNIPPFPNNIPPFPNNIPPFPNNIPPFPNNIPPFPNNFPFSNNISPFPNNIPPYPNNMPPFPNNIPPFPHNLNYVFSNMNEPWIPPPPFGINSFISPDVFYSNQPTTSSSVIITELDSDEPTPPPPKRRRGRPRKDQSQKQMEKSETNKTSSKSSRNKKNEPIASGSGITPQKRRVGRPRLNKNQQSGNKKSLNTKDDPLITVPPEQEFKTICGQFDEEYLPILKLPTENFLNFPKKNLRSIKALAETIVNDYNFEFKITDLPNLRKNLGFPEKLPLLMNQLSWDPKASCTDIAKYGCQKCLMCFRYQYDFVMHECEEKELASFCTNCWTMYPHKPRKKRRKNGINPLEGKEAEKLRKHSCNLNNSLLCTLCNLQFVNSFDMLQHYNLHYI